MRKNVYILKNTNSQFRGCQYRVAMLADIDISKKISDEEIFNFFDDAPSFNGPGDAYDRAVLYKSRLFLDRDTDIVSTIEADFNIFYNPNRQYYFVLKTKNDVMRLVGENLSESRASDFRKVSKGFRDFNYFVPEYGSGRKINASDIRQWQQSGRVVHIIDFSDRFYPGDENFIFTPKQINSIYETFVDVTGGLAYQQNIALIGFDLVIEQLRPIVEQSAHDTLTCVMDGVSPKEDMEKLYGWMDKDKHAIVQLWKDLYRETFENENPNAHTVMMVDIDADKKMFFYALK